MELRMERKQMTNYLSYIYLFLCTIGCSSNQDKGSLIHCDSTTISDSYIVKTGIQDSIAMSKLFYEEYAPDTFRNLIDGFWKDLYSPQKRNKKEYNLYFNETSEIELVFRNRYERNELRGFNFSNEKNASLTMEYLHWKLNRLNFKSTCQIIHFDEILKYDDGGGRIVKVDFSCRSNVLYFTFPNLKADSRVIWGIYDHKGNSLIDSANIFELIQSQTHN